MNNMHFPNEKTIEIFILFSLKVDPDRNSQIELTSNDIIDIMTDEYAIEVKRELTPSTLDKGAGQLMRYRPYVGNRKLILAGITPSDYSQSVINRIESLRVSGIEVWLVDQMPVFVDNWAHFDSIYHQELITMADQKLPEPQPATYPVTSYLPGIQSPQIVQGMNPIYSMGYQFNYPNVDYLQQTSDLQRAQNLYGDNRNTNFAPVDLMNRDVDGDGKPDPIHLYRTDDISVFHWVIGGFFSFFFLVSAVGLYVAYEQERMPIRWQSILFQREYQIPESRLDRNR